VTATAAIRRTLAAALVGAAMSSGAASAAEVPITELDELPNAYSQPSGIAIGADGSAWFTELAGRGDGTQPARIGQMSPDGKLTEYDLPGPGGEPTGIVAGPDGNLWFTESGIDKIGRITPEGKITEFGGLVPGASPQDIAAGPDGALWFTEGGYNQGNRIGRIDPASGAVNEFCIRRCDAKAGYGDSGLRPAQIVAGPDGRLWFTESNPATTEPTGPDDDQGTGYVAAITTSGAVSEYPVPTANAQPRGITVGPDGALWFTERRGNRVGRVTTGGEVTEFNELPTADSRPGRIIAPGDGNLWVAEGDGNRLAVVDTSGQATELAELATKGGEPAGMAVDAQGTLWITELSGNRLAKTQIALLKKDEPAKPPAAAAPPAGGQAASSVAEAALARLLDGIGTRLRTTGLARLVRAGRLAIVLRAPAKGTLSVKLTALSHGRRVVVAKARRAFRAAGSARATLMLTKAGRRLLRHRRSLTTRLTITFTNADGEHSTATRKLVLSAAGRRAPSRSGG